MSIRYIFQEWSNAVNDLVAECLIKDFDQRPFMQVSVLFLYYQLYTVTIAWVMWETLRNLEPYKRVAQPRCFQEVIQHPLLATVPAVPTYHQVQIKPKHNIKQNQTIENQSFTQPH